MEVNIDILQHEILMRYSCSTITTKCLVEVLWKGKSGDREQEVNQISHTNEIRQYLFICTWLI
jgi:hypothetical protein